jgi:Mn-dependent DtxR family transcriptional regulator
MLEELTLKDSVFREFLKNPSLGPSEMTELLGANYNSVKAAFAKLAEEGLLERPSRGNYEPNIAVILLDLMDRVKILENKVNT